MNPADDALSAADMAALADLTACHLDTHKAVQELARTIAARHLIELPMAKPGTSQPQPVKLRMRGPASFQPHHQTRPRQGRAGHGFGAGKDVSGLQGPRMADSMLRNCDAVDRRTQEASS